MWFGITVNQRNIAQRIINFAIRTFPADVTAPLGAMSSAGTMKQLYCECTGQVLELLVINSDRNYNSDPFTNMILLKSQYG